MFSESIPAWVQAVGSIVGIAIAIAVPAWQRRSEMRFQQLREDREARALVLAIFAQMLNFRNSVRDCLRSVVDDHVDLASVIRELKFPSSLQERLHELHRFGPVSNSLQSVAYWYGRIDATRLRIESASVATTRRSRDEIFLRAGREDLRRLNEACAESQHALEAMLKDFFVKGINSTQQHWDVERQHRSIREVKS